MKKLVKNKNGFTLLEMLIVIAIAIAIIAAVLTSGITKLYDGAEEKSDKLAKKYEENDNTYSTYESNFKEYGF